MNQKEKFFAVIRGEMIDQLLYFPRLDLWYGANEYAGTLPENYRGRTADEIARAYGWGLHKINPQYNKVRSPEDTLHWGLGLLSLKETVYTFQFPPDIEIQVKTENGRTKIFYHTPVGSISTTTLYTEDMKKAGVSAIWIEEHAIKSVKDYKALGYIFENIKIIACDQDFKKWQEEVGSDGVCFTLAGRASSPMHHIQKYLINETDFYYQYNDYQKEMRTLAEKIGVFFDQILQIIAESTAEVVYWGGNFDEMLTYPSFFQKEILPWIQKASDVLGKIGKYVSCHCDGENHGLLDLIRDSGMHIAEAICPAPMTKVPIDEYYQKWSDKLTIFGGIPSILLLSESTTDEEFEAYLDYFFKAIAPGQRMIVGIADSVPPKAKFERVIRIGERIEKEGRLPLEAGAFRPLGQKIIEGVSKKVSKEIIWDKEFQIIQNDVLEGNQDGIKQHIENLLKQGAKAEDILQRGMISAMEIINERFKSGEVFIPEVLLSARAMNEAIKLLEPYLAGGKQEAKGKVMIGTVKGDLHDIGKNLVLTMLKGVGFETVDLGIDVPPEEFIRKVKEEKPDILGMSALLTTTMPQMKIVIQNLIKEGIRDKVKVIVGGAPLNEKFARDIGADGYAPDAGGAVALVKQLIIKES